MCHSDTGWEVKLGEQGKKYLARTQQECTFKGVVIVSFSYRYVLLLLLSPTVFKTQIGMLQLLFATWGCLKMRCLFGPPKCEFRKGKRAPHFETSPHRVVQFILSSDSMSPFGTRYMMRGEAAERLGFLRQTWCRRTACKST